MKRLFLTFILVAIATSLQAQTITCSASGATTKQATQYAAFLAGINAERTAQNPPLPPFANFNEHCASMMLAAFQSYVAYQNTVDATKAGAALKAHGDEVAPNAQCAAASLANGCLKAQVACFVLTGNTTCN